YKICHAHAKKCDAENNRDILQSWVAFAKAFPSPFWQGSGAYGGEQNQRCEAYDCVECDR
ncbi:MAG: hypothetical protein J6V22_04910, partial [Clostridia bacterium]|nr:hypothetical protein [Clostridia bacterium]